MFSFLIRVRPSKKSILFSLSLVLYGFLFLSALTSPSRADYVVIDWGDVVKIKLNVTYIKPGDASPTWVGDIYRNIYLGDTITPEMNQTYDRVVIMPEPFSKKIVGMRVGEKRAFSLSYIELDITNTSEDFYGADINYNVEFLEMLMDQKADIFIELHPLHPVVVIPFVLAMGGLYIAYDKGYLSKGYHQVLRLSAPSCAVCGIRSNHHCVALDCRKPLCRTCFEKEGGCPFCGGFKLSK
ncbi:MAG: hypothetical protein ACXACR_10535 [Candidatus Hodarchaeales archaeon]|jgi:hypothetical protein